MLRDKGCWWPKWPNTSPTPENCHQHISSPTSVTKIDVAIMGHDLKTYIFLKRSDYKTFLRISISVVASFDIFTFVQSHIDTFPWVKIFWEIEKFKLIFFILCTNIWKKVTILSDHMIHLHFPFPACWFQLRMSRPRNSIISTPR